MKRRSFLKTVGGVMGAATLSAPSMVHAQAAVAEPSATSAMPRRPLGRTGEEVSIIGFPGLSLVHEDQEGATAAIHDAFERGVNYFDVAPAYGRGDAEVKMGIGLQGIPRDKIFLACKTQLRDAKGAREELERSLERLKTDRFDLYQLHALRQPDEVKQALGPGGAIETFQKAKEEGKVRFFGFSAHTTKSALQAMRHFRFDTVMFPINFIEYHTLGFGKAVLDLAREQGAGVVAIKPMCRGAWPEGAERTRKWWYRPVEELAEIDLVVRFTLSQPGVASGFPPAFVDLLDKAIEVAADYRPLNDAESEQVRKLAESCQSIFRREEQQVAHRLPHKVLYPDSPHECCGGQYA